MSAPDTTLAQVANQQMAVVAVSVSGMESVWGESSPAQIRFRMHLFRCIFAMALRSAGIPVPTCEVRGKHQLAASQFDHEGECVWVIHVGDTPVEQVTGGLLAGLELLFIEAALLEKYVGVAHLDWNEGRWLREFPNGAARPFAPWLDYLEHLRKTTHLSLLGPDARRMIGCTDDV